mgnify:CR=1 FL=1
MPGDGGGEVGRASHGLEACDFRHAGLRLEWGHEHSPDAFEVFALGATENLLLFDACKAPRLFRLIRFVKRFDKLTGANMLRLLWLFMWFVLFSHLTACIWWAIGAYDLRHADEFSLSWVRRTSTRDLEGAPLDQKYLSSLYWALTTLLKTPWVGPDTMLEKAFTSLMIVLGTFVFALLQGFTGDII